MVCTEEFHGHYNKELVCINCRDKHKPTSKDCQVYQYNRELKRIMAYDNVSIKQAKETLHQRPVRDR